MPRIMTLKRVQARMRLLERSINSLTKRQLRKGFAVSYGTFSVPTPNTTKGRTPNPFSGGN